MAVICSLCLSWSEPGGGCNLEALSSNVNNLGIQWTTLLNGVAPLVMVVDTNPAMQD